MPRPFHDGKKKGGGGGRKLCLIFSTYYRFISQIYLCKISAVQDPTVDCCCIIVMNNIEAEQVDSSIIHLPSRCIILC